MLPIKTVEFFWLNCLKQPVRRSGRPSSVNEVDSFPPRGSLDVRQTIFDVFAIEKTV